MIRLSRVLAAFAAALFTLPWLLGVAHAGPTESDDRSARHAQPLERAHAHNDYEHERPLLDALDQGFTSVEADVWLVEGGLHIGHDAPDMDRTLANTYLEPLREIAARGDGEMPAAERRVLDRIVKLAHLQGYEVRFWATPDAPGPARDALWATLVDADVDQINTDDLAGLARFLTAHDPRERGAGQG